MTDAQNSPPTMDRCLAFQPGLGGGSRRVPEIMHQRNGHQGEAGQHCRAAPREAALNDDGRPDLIAKDKRQAGQRPPPDQQLSVSAQPPALCVEMKDAARVQPHAHSLIDGITCSPNMRTVSSP